MDTETLKEFKDTILFLTAELNGQRALVESCREDNAIEEMNQAAQRAIHLQTAIDSLTAMLKVQ